MDRIRQAEIGPSLINIQSNRLVDYLNYQRQGQKWPCLFLLLLSVRNPRFLNMIPSNDLEVYSSTNNSLIHLRFKCFTNSYWVEEFDWGTPGE